MIKTGLLVAILTIFQLNGMMTDKKKIWVYFSPSAAKELGIRKGGLRPIPMQSAIEVNLGTTTANDILKEIAVTKNIDRHHQHVMTKGRTDFTVYVNQTLKDAYDKGFLSLWTIKEGIDSDLPKEKIPSDDLMSERLMAETYNDSFYIRYKK